jgi:hypothetical protein
MNLVLYDILSTDTPPPPQAAGAIQLFRDYLIYSEIWFYTPPPPQAAGAIQLFRDYLIYSEIWFYNSQLNIIIFYKSSQAYSKDDRIARLLAFFGEVIQLIVDK